MSEFESVLAAVESRESSAVIRPWAPPEIDGRMRGPIAANPKNATTIYLRASSQEDDGAPSIDEFYARSLADIQNAGGCPARLRALRRKFAWRLHPDRCSSERQHASAVLARLNSLVDAALHDQR